MEPERVDLSVIDPRRNEPRFDAAVSRIAQRALELRRVRRAIIRRAGLAAVVAMAANLLLWVLSPMPAVESRQPDVLDWATRDIDTNDVLGVGHAQ